MTDDLSNVIALPPRSGRQINDAAPTNVDLAAAVGNGMPATSLPQQTIAAQAQPPLILFRGDPLKSAKELLKRFFTIGGMRVLIFWRGVFYQWDGTKYAEIDEGTKKANLWKYLGDAYVMDGRNMLPYCPTRRQVGEVHEALAAECTLASNKEPPTWLNHASHSSSDEVFALQNGLLVLPTGVLRQPTPAYFNLHASSVAYLAAAPQPVHWLAFLASLWPNDQIVIDTLQEIFGYLLSSDTSQQKIFLIVGPKRSGKGTILRVLTSLLGQSSVVSPTLDGLTTNFGLQALIGKAVAVLGDARLGGRTNQAALTGLLLTISGEDGVTIDRKYLSPWTGRLRTRFIIATNELPRLNDASGALASRFILLTMTQSFYGHEDHALQGRLLGELPGVLNWAREGYLRLKARGHFVQPPSSSDAIADLEALGSPVGSFIEDRCTVASGRRCQVEALFGAWSVWCVTNGRKEPGTTHSFGRDLRAVVPGIKVTQQRTSAGRVRHYEGIDLAP